MVPLQECSAVTACIAFCDLFGIPDANRGMWSYHAFDDKCADAGKKKPKQYYYNYTTASGTTPPTWDEIFASTDKDLTPPLRLPDVRFAKKTNAN